MRIQTKIGDVFSVKIDDKGKKYFQYITNDLTQLNSDVIRVFKKIHAMGAEPDIKDIVENEVDFYAHCVTKLGVQSGFWEKIGNNENVGNFNHVLFRDSGDYGNPKIKTSFDWWIWKINEPQKRVGKLEGENTKAEIGLVMNPENIVHRIKTGGYSFQGYPGY